MNCFNFPYFSRLIKPDTVNCYVFFLVFTLTGNLQGKVFLNVFNCSLLRQSNFAVCMSDSKAENLLIPYLSVFVILFYFPQTAQ